MAPVPPVLSSAVIIPDTDRSLARDHVAVKRRQSSVSTADSKRPRLSAPEQLPRETPDAKSVSSAASVDRPGEDLEERKRGKRLFGALLGTLNQSSSTTAHRRRGDIERKQQEKLALQTQERDGQRKKDREALLAARRRERDVYVRQAATTQRDNTLACARFLQTATEPKLYYKPWELLMEQNTRIESQIGEAELAADNHISEAITVTGSARAEKDTDTNQSHTPMKSANEEPTGIVGDTIDQASVVAEQAGIAGAERPSTESSKASESGTPREGAEDGGGDFVKGDEDDVIY